MDCLAVLPKAVGAVAAAEMPGAAADPLSAEGSSPVPTPVDTPAPALPRVPLAPTAAPSDPLPLVDTPTFAPPMPSALAPTPTDTPCEPALNPAPTPTPPTLPPTSRAEAGAIVIPIANAAAAYFLMATLLCGMIAAHHSSLVRVELGGRVGTNAAGRAMVAARSSSGGFWTLNLRLSDCLRADPERSDMLASGVGRTDAFGMRFMPTMRRPASALTVPVACRAALRLRAKPIDLSRSGSNAALNTAAASLEASRSLRTLSRSRAAA